MYRSEQKTHKAFHFTEILLISHNDIIDVTDSTMTEDYTPSAL